MIDKCRISVPYLELDPRVLGDHRSFSAEHNFPELAFLEKHSADPEGGASLIITPFKNKAVVISAVVEPTPRVFAIQVNPGKLLFGHNGIPLCTDLLLCAAITEFKEVLRPFFLRERDLLRAIPGLAKGGARWTDLEIAINLRDPDGAVLRSFMNCKHPGIRKKPLIAPGESLSLRGSEMKIGVYRKDLEMAKLIKRNSGGDCCSTVRIEYTLRKRLLARRFGHGEGELARFSVRDLIRVHRSVTSELQGVFGSDDGGSSGARGRRNEKPSAVARFTHALAVQGKGSSSDLINLFITVNGSSANTRRRLFRDVMALLEKSSALRLDDLFGDSAYVDQAFVRIPELERQTPRWRRGTWVCPLVAGAYWRRNDRNFHPAYDSSELHCFL